jgi:hypothetical protein
MKRKRGRPRTHKNKKKQHQAWYNANRDHVLEYQRNYYQTHLKARRQKKAAAVNPANPNDSLNTLGVGAPLLFEKRLAALEKEVKDILLDLEEVLKENKKISDTLKWRTK